LNLGLLYLRDSRLPEAEAAFKTALELKPNNAVAGNELGIVERKLGKFAEAEAAYQRTIAPEPNYAQPSEPGRTLRLYLAQRKKRSMNSSATSRLPARTNRWPAGWWSCASASERPAPAPRRSPYEHCDQNLELGGPVLRRVRCRFGAAADDTPRGDTASAGDIGAGGRTVGKAAQADGAIRSR